MSEQNMDMVKFTVTLPRETVAQIEAIAGVNHTSLAQALATSVSLNKALTEAVQKQSKVLLQRPDGSFRLLKW